MNHEQVKLAETYDRVAARLVGRERELTLMLAAVAAGRDLILEGPPGTSKSTLLRAITAEWGIPLFFVEGNADLTPAKLVGHHNPARVLREDYSPDNFVDGPLLEAMRAGGFLYIEEFNRAPADTLNTLLTALAERQIAVPTAGIVTAAATHGVVGLMRTLALELAPDFIRVNSVHPTSVNTDMIQNAATYELFAPDLPVAQRTKEVLAPRFQEMNALPIPWVEPVDISNAVLWLASDESRYVTGVTLPIDAGQLTK